MAEEQAKKRWTAEIIGLLAVITIVAGAVMPFFLPTRQHEFVYSSFIGAGSSCEVLRVEHSIPHHHFESDDFLTKLPGYPYSLMDTFISFDVTVSNTSSEDITCVVDVFLGCNDSSNGMKTVSRQECEIPAHGEEIVEVCNHLSGTDIYSSTQAFIEVVQTASCSE